MAAVDLALLDLLADAAQKNENPIGWASLKSGLSQWTDPEVVAAVKFMHSLGAIERVIAGSGEPVVGVIVSASAIAIKRQIEANRSRRPDFVSQIRERIRSNPRTAWLLIGLGLTYLAADFVNRLWELWDRIWGP